jgi:hypothetical protein
MSMSMMGSGIYCQEITIEIVCREDGCEDCGQNICNAVWKQDVTTDDWGNIDETVTCAVCKHRYRVRR